MTAAGRRRDRAARPRWGRRLSTALVAAGLASVAAGASGMLTADAAQAPGSNFGSIDIGASAYGLRVPFFNHAGEDVESELPYSLAQLSYSGHAVTSVMWPGDTGAHGGDTLKLLTGSCVPPNPFNTIPIPVPVPIPDLPCVTTVPALPDQVYESLNDPYKAEAQSGTGDPVVTKSHPGVEMSATATQELVEAATTIAGVQLPTLGDGLGATLTDARIKLTGPNTAVVDAVSTMRDIDLGGGALTISSIRSVAHAVTTGKTATGSGSTVVEGMKVGGVPVTVDDKGLHVQGTGLALPSTDALNKVLENAGITIYVANPSRTVKKASVQVFSGQLIVQLAHEQYNDSLNATGTVLTLGGASINADSSPAYVYQPGPIPAFTPPPSTGPTRTVVPPASGGSVPPAGGTVPPDVATSPPAAQPPVLAASPTALPGGIAPGWIVAVIAGTVLLAAGLRRLPDVLFADRGPACSLGGEA